MTNELLEREEQIQELKRRDAEYSQKIATKDKLYEQDAVIRMQLGKRLEQVIMDKEDAMEQIEFYKVIIFLFNIVNLGIHGLWKPSSPEFHSRQGALAPSVK